MPRDSLRTLMLAIICAILVLASMKLGEALFAPMVAAIVLGVVFAPITDKVERLGLPRAGAALLVLFLFLGFTISLFLLIEPTISRAIRNGPIVWREVTEIGAMLKARFAGLNSLQATVSEALGETAGAPGREDAMEFPGVLDALAYAPSIASGLLVFVGTLYFFLVARSDIYRKVDKLKVSLSHDMLREAESRVSRYLITISIINAVFGVAVALAMTAIGLPGALIWGLAAFLVNYVLFLGPAMFTVALLVGGILAFDGAASFIPAAVYVGMNVTEGQFVTPSLVGRHMEVNPLLVFVSLVFWLWLWGPLGGIVAIPLLVWLLFVFEKLSRPPVPTVSINAKGAIEVVA